MAYKIPKIQFNEDDLNGFHIGGQLTKDELISGAKLAATAALYGIGVGRAIKNLSYPQPSDYEKQSNSPDAALVNGIYQKSSGWDGYMSSSLIGMPVMSYIKFTGGTYIDLQGNTIIIPDIILENVLITLTMNKNIQDTQISGRDTGEVTEYIGMLNWDVELKVVISADVPVSSLITKVLQDGVYPRDNMEAIYKLLKAPIALPVESWFLNQMFDIKFLTVRSGVNIEQVAGEYSTQRITIPCKSDNPLIIKLGA